MNQQQPPSNDSLFIGHLLLTPSYDYITEFNERFSEFLNLRGEYRVTVGRYDCFKYTQQSRFPINIEQQSNYGLFSQPSQVRAGIGIPSRNVFIVAATTGQIDNEQELLDQVAINDPSNQGSHLLPAKLLARINRADSTENDVSNYRQLIYERVYKKIEGNFAAQLAYISPKPSFILLNRGVPIFIFLVYYRGLFILVWSTEQNLLQDFERFLKVNYDKDSYFSFCCPLLVSLDSVLVLCPSFLVPKLRKWKQVYKEKGGSILIAANLKSYLDKIAVLRNYIDIWERP